MSNLNLQEEKIYDSQMRANETQEEELIKKGYKIGQLGEAYIPRSVINSFRLIPIQKDWDEDSKKLAYRINSFANLFYFSVSLLNKNKFQLNLDPRKNLHLQMCLAVMKDGLKEVIEIPRDHYKSTVYSECFPMWRALPFTDKDADTLLRLGCSEIYIEWMKKAHKQNIRILLVSEVTKNAEKLGKRIRNHYESNAFFKSIFEEIIPDAKCVWTNNSLHHKRTPEGMAFGEGTFDFIGVGGALQSTHYDLSVQDDLVGRDALKSETVMNDTIEYHKLIVGAMDADSEDGARDFDELVVGNRWSFKDLNSFIRLEEPYFNFITHSALGGCCRLHPYGTPIFPENFSFTKLARWKRRLGSYLFSCFPEDAPVLMADFTEKKISDLKIGDEIVGYNTSKYLNIEKAKVEYINIRKAKIYEYKVVCGTEIRAIRCTEDHKFLRGNHRDRLLYDSLHIGDSIVSVYKPLVKPSEEEQRNLDWLGGILDGEGSCTITNIYISQSPNANPDVWAGIHKTLQELNINYTFRNDSEQFVLTGGRNLIIKFINHSKMFKKERFIKRIWDRPGRLAEDGGSQCTVLSKTCIGECNVYNIQSSTGNYVAYGFAVKNCQFLNFPINPEKCKFEMPDLRYYEYVPDDSGATFIRTREKPVRVKIRHRVAEGDVDEDIFPKILDRYMVVDPNHAGNKGRCRHAITVTGVRQDKRRIYLLKHWAKAASEKEFVEQIFKIALQFKLTKVHLETVGFQKFLKFHLEYFQTVNKDKPEWKGIELIKFVELKSSNTENAKEVRIDAFIPIVERHEFWINTDDCEEVREEMKTYGNKGALIDILDTLGYGTQIWQFRETSEEELENFIEAQKNRFIRAMAHA